MAKTRKLGRGLSSLMTAEPVEVAVPESAVNRTHGTLVVQLGIDEIIPNKYQPRISVHPTALAELAASIRQTGVMQPVIVRPADGGGYELVAGERRWRAAMEAGLGTIPAIVRELSDEQSAEWALIENVQREDLNPVERARAFANLSDRFGLTHAQIAERVGIDRTSVTNLLRILDLEPRVLDLVGDGRLSLGHAKALLAFPPGEGRVRVAQAAVRDSWSVRRVEAAARGAGGSGGGDRPKRPANLVELERQLGEHLGTKVHIMADRKGEKGRIALEFYSLEHFDGLMAKMGFEAKT